MSKAKEFIEAVKEYTHGTGKTIRDLEKKLGLEPKDLFAIEDIYDYLDELIAKARERGIS